MTNIEPHLLAKAVHAVEELPHHYHPVVHAALGELEARARVTQRTDTPKEGDLAPQAALESQAVLPSDELLVERQAEQAREEVVTHLLEFAHLSCHRHRRMPRPRELRVAVQRKGVRVKQALVVAEGAAAGPELLIVRYDVFVDRGLTAGETPCRRCP